MHCRYSAVEQTLLECQYREEWRVQREERLQQLVQSFTFASCR